MKNRICSACLKELPLSSFSGSARECKQCRGVQRRCKGCHILKPASEFHRSTSKGHGGYEYRCVECCKKASRKGSKTCKTCLETIPAHRFRSNSKECPKCDGKLRRCHTCKQVKPLADFHKVAGGSGLRRTCKTCVAHMRRDEYHRRERKCAVCGKIKKSFPLNYSICSECHGAKKRCPKCGQVKSINDFHKDAKNPQGRQAYCIPCTAERDREFRQSIPTQCTHCKRLLPRTAFEEHKRICNECRSSGFLTCFCCGKEKLRSEFRDCDLKKIAVASICISCSNERLRARTRTPRGRWNFANATARKTGRKFEIPFEEYCKLISQPCAYCQQPLNPTGGGLDRIDSTGHYMLDNVVPCCQHCNQTKSATFTYDEMLVIGEAIGRVMRQRKHAESPESSVES